MKIAIIGNAGGGKSHLARRLQAALQLPLFVIDDIQWQEDWARTPLDQVAAIHADWLKNDAWIIDGWGAMPLIDARFEQATHILLVDYPFRIHAWWAFKRQVKACLGFRQGWPPKGCSAWKMTFQLIRIMIRVDRELLPSVRDLALAGENANRLIHIRSPRGMREAEATLLQQQIT